MKKVYLREVASRIAERTGALTGRNEAEVSPRTSVDDRISSGGVTNRGSNDGWELK